MDRCGRFGRRFFCRARSQGKALVDAMAAEHDLHSGNPAQPFPGMDALAYTARAVGLQTALVSKGRGFIQAHK